MSKPADHILEKAVIRCKKAQAVARPYNTKHNIKAGLAVEKKIKVMLELTQKDDFGNLTVELEALNNMIINMQKAVLEPLLESIETIERRMYNFLEVNEKSQTNVSIDADEEATLTNSQAEFQYDPNESKNAQEVGRELPPQTESFVEGTGDYLLEEENACSGLDTETIQKNFFERLTHFLDLQGTIDGKVAQIDPEGKIAEMKVRPHSKGIEDKDGTYKASYRQKNTEGKTVKNLSELYEAAQQAMPEFKALLGSLVDATDELSDKDYKVAKIKDHKRSVEKTDEDYKYRQPGPPEAWLYDILRASIECSSYKQFSDIYRWLKDNTHIANSENRFDIPRFDGYRDFLYHVVVMYNGGASFICEIQVHHKDLRRLAGENISKNYFRPYFSGYLRDDMDSLRDLDMIRQLGCVDDQLMEFLLESTDSAQLKLFARLFFERLDESSRALELLKRVLTMEEAAYGKGNIITGTTYRYIGLILMEKDDPDGALLYFREGLAVLEMNLGVHHSEVALLHDLVGKVLSMQGRYDDALEEFRCSLAIREELFGSDHMHVAVSHNRVGEILKTKGEFSNALSEYKKALAILESIFGRNSLHGARTQSEIGNIFSEQGEYQKALKYHEKVCDLYQKAFTKKNSRNADSLTNMGNVKLNQGLVDEAETLFRKALAIREEFLGSKHRDCAISYSNLGAVLKVRGDLKGSITAYRLGLSIRTKTLGRLHFDTSSSFFDLGSILVLKKSYNDAVSHFTECLAIRKQLYGRNHPHVAQVLNALGNVKSIMGDHIASQTEHGKALRIFEKCLGDSHPEIAKSFELFGESFARANNIPKALEHHRRALSMRTSLFGKRHPCLFPSYVAIGSLLDISGDLEEAKSIFRSAIEAYATPNIHCKMEIAALHQLLCQTLRKQNLLDEAESEIRKTIAAREEFTCPSVTLVAESYELLGSILNEKGDKTESQRWLEKATAIRTNLKETNENVRSRVKGQNGASSVGPKS